MAKEKDTVEEEVKLTKKEKTEREERWEALLVAYEKRNPVKYASKKANGEFANIPESFV